MSQIAWGRRGWQVDDEEAGDGVILAPEEGKTLLGDVAGHVVPVVDHIVFRVLHLVGHGGHNGINLVDLALFCK